MTLAALTESRPWLVAGWTMLHFLWVGGVLGLVAALGRRMLRSARPEVRYGFALSCLGALAVAPGVIAWFLAVVRAPEPIRAGTVSRGALGSDRLATEMPVRLPPIALSAPGIEPNRPRPVPPSEGPPWGRVVGDAVARLPWVWLAGAPAMFVLLATGLVGAERLRRQSRSLVEGEIGDLARRLAASIGIARPVTLAVCDRVVSPLLLGVVRPLILLPPALLTGWSPEQVEMALLHELAHVRRWDNLVNLGQRLVESVLFFHPVVWWVSAWVRLEREHCCDRLVVTQTGLARPYAELLASLSEPGVLPTRAAVAMAERPVLARIRRILNREDHAMSLSRPFAALASALLIGPAVLLGSQPAAPKQAEPARKAAPEPLPAPAQESIDRAKLDDLLRRARRGVDMFQDVQGRAYALTQLAAAQARAGDSASARPTLREAAALGAIVSLDESMYVPHVLILIAQAQERLGFHDDAADTERTVLRLIEMPAQQESIKQDVYTWVLSRQVKRDDRAGVQETLRLARRFCETSKDPFVVSGAGVFLVKLLARTGDLAGAQRMSDDPALFHGADPDSVAKDRFHALFAIVDAIGPGQSDGAEAALDAARRANDAHRDDPTWGGVMGWNQQVAQLAEAQARLGRFDDARKLASTIDVDTTPDGLEEQSKGEFLDHQRFKKADAFAMIAEKQADAGDRAGALQSARDLLEIVAAIPSAKFIPLPKIRALQILARLGETREATETARTASPAVRFELFSSIADAQRQAGDEAGARTTLKVALEIVREQIGDPDVPDFSDRFLLSPEQQNVWLARWARIQGQLGDDRSALDAIVHINDTQAQNQAFRRLAEDRAAAGDLDGATLAVRHISGPKGEAEALEAIVGAIGRRKAEPGR